MVDEVQRKRWATGKLVAIPLAVSALLLVPILVKGMTMDRDLAGGSLITAYGPGNGFDRSDVETAVNSVFGTRAEILFFDNWFQVETDLISGNQVDGYRSTLAGQLGIAIDYVTVETMGPTVSGVQREHLLYSFIGAFIGAGAVLYIVFRRRVVPLAVALVAGLDILCVFGYMALFQVPLGVVSVVGMLMLVCFVADTNVLLAWGIFKKTGGEPRERAAAAINTVTVISTVVIIISICLNVLAGTSPIKTLTAVLIFGMAVNMLNTRLLGGETMLRYFERRKVKDFHVSV